MKNQNNRLFKTDKEKSELIKNVQLLHKKFDSDEIFEALAKVATGSDENYLTHEVIKYLNIYKGMDVVKFEGLSQRMQFQEKMEVIYPYQNERDANLFFSY